jgi:uncharacterized OB-fold protein
VNAPPIDPRKYLERVLDTSAREFYRRLAEDGELATTRCEPCGLTAFPPRPGCPSCGEAMAWVGLPREGTLHAFTMQEAAVRFRAPEVLALAEVGGVVVPGIATAPYEKLAIGQAVRVVLRPEPETELTLLAFEPS